MSEFPGLNAGGNIPWGAKGDPNAPWNRDETEYDFSEEDLVEYVMDREGDAGGGVVYEDEENWRVEIPTDDLYVPGEGWLKVLKNGAKVWIVDAETQAEGYSRLVAERYEEIEEELREKKQEEDADVALYG